MKPNNLILSYLHDGTLHSVVVLKTERLAAIELLAIEGELHARLARLLEVTRGQHEAHLAFRDVRGRHSLLDATHAHADADLASLHKAAAEHTYWRAALDRPSGRAEARDTCGLLAG